MKAIVRTRNDCLRYVQEWWKFGDGKPYTLELKPYKALKTNDQNRLLHALIGELADHCGYPPAVMKDVVKAMFGPMHTSKKFGVTIPKSVADYTPENISNLIERVYQVGAEHGCVFQER